MAKCTGEQQKSPQLLSKVMEKQFTRFICITYRGKQDGSDLEQMNDVRSSWSENKFFLWQNVWAAQQIWLKIVLTFDCGNGETIYTFKLYSLPRGA